ncbi:MAG: nucleotide exchange factor GrpE [Planctomycetaceae bacterium]|nr:nucleotide exchange factor GrpE [Planctomycetaceae bacterium]
MIEQELAEKPLHLFQNSSPFVSESYVFTEQDTNSTESDVLVTPNFILVSPESEKEKRNDISQNSSFSSVSESEELTEQKAERTENEVFVTPNFILVPTESNETNELNEPKEPDKERPNDSFQSDSLSAVSESEEFAEQKEEQTENDLSVTPNIFSVSAEPTEEPEEERPNDSFQSDSFSAVSESEKFSEQNTERTEHDLSVTPDIFSVSTEPTEEPEEEEDQSVEPEDFQDSEPILSERREEILNQFFNWFATSDEIEDEYDEADAPPQIGLYQVFETLTAQRHELKLFTKSSRQTQELIEKNQELIEKNIEETSQTLEQLRRFRKERPEIERKAVQPYLTSLIEIDESLQRAGAALNVLQDRLTGLVYERISTLAKAYCDELTIWQRFWRRRSIQHFAKHLAKQHVVEIERILEPFRLGYEMTLNRMNDVLKKHSICRLLPIGEPVDPETMRVVATVESETVEPGCVVEVVRAGYLWRGKPFRFADVRAAVRPQVKH